MGDENGGDRAFGHQRGQFACNARASGTGCFRLERLPGGTCTHWKAPPLHGAHVKRSLEIAAVDAADGRGAVTLQRQIEL